MPFESILYPPDAVQPPRAELPPQLLTDLGLDQIVARLGKSCEALWPFYTPVQDDAVVQYRQAVMRDLEDLSLRRRFAALARQLRALQRQLSAQGMEQLPYVRSSDVLAAAEQYTAQLQEFIADFPYRTVQSKGIESFLLYLRDCLNRTIGMRMNAMALERELKRIQYTILLKGREIRVGKPDGHASIDKLVETLFGRFQQAGHGTGTCQAPAGETDVQNENAILTLLAGVYPDLFAKLLEFGETYRDFADQKLFQFASDIWFYLSYLDETDRIKRLGIAFCYPEVTDCWDGCRAEGSFDLALAARLADRQACPVQNGFELCGSERILVVTGPNQGGKTTYARMLCQLFYLASLGVRVPGSAAALRLPDRIFTHFGKTGAGGADNLCLELLRLREILNQATERSLVLINEIFASVSHSDGLYLGTQMMELLERIGCMAVCVTFLEELASCGAHTVSMTSRILPETSDRRSYQILQHAPDGHAYALSLLEKKGLTYDQIMGRLTE